MLRETRIALWRISAVLALALGLIGVMLPVLPTIPFLIGAAFAGGRGWPRLEKRLLGHATYGPQIRAWRERRVVPRRAKRLATFGMCASAVTLQFLPLPMLVRVGVPVVMVVVGWWLWRQAEV